MTTHSKTELWADLRPAAAIAQIFTFIALVIYLFNILPDCMCVTFRPQFFRQLAYIFQTIRLFLLMAGLLPCLLHWQVLMANPDARGNYFALSVLLALLGNILVAIGLRKFIECNQDALMCLWYKLPFTRPYMAATNDACCQFCCSDQSVCCPRTCGVANTVGSRSCCKPEPVCCPRPRPGRPPKNRCCPTPNSCCPPPKCSKPKPCCPTTTCPKPAKPKCRKSGCAYQ